MGFSTYDMKDPLKVYEEVEDAARDEILLNGGCISHHHVRF
jgi:alkyldihydroxyacetonephosphate synthase